MPTPARAGETEEDPLMDRPATVTVLAVSAWCAGCREEAEFVVPVGLADAGPDELACLQCGWAVLVAADGPADEPASRAA